VGSARIVATISAEASSTVQHQVCAVLSSVRATTVDNSGVYVYYMKGIVSVCFRCMALEHAFTCDDDETASARQALLSAGGKLLLTCVKLRALNHTLINLTVSVMLTTDTRTTKMIYKTHIH